MGILGFLFRVIREKVQEKSAKGDLEGKLGRKVSTHDLYSLGSHLDAAQPTTAPQSLQSTPREASVPFAEAKPPMRTKTKLIIAGVLVLVIGFIGVVAAAGFVIFIMPRSTYNKLNPFTPKPSPDDFPAQIGRFTRSTDPEYLDLGYSDKPTDTYFYSYYKAADPNDPNKRAADATNLKLYVWHFKTADEARSGLEAKKKEIKAYQGYQFVDDTDARFAALYLKGGSTSVIWTDGTKLRELTGASQKTIYEFEGLLKNAAPVAVVDVKLTEPEPSSNSTNSSSLTVSQLLDDYKKDSSAADKKYKGKTISVTGKVEVSDKDKKGNWMIAFMRPGSTAPKDGMVICSFDKSQESRVSSVKKGDIVTLQGNVFGNILFSVIMQNCSKL